MSGQRGQKTVSVEALRVLLADPNVTQKDAAKILHCSFRAVNTLVHKHRLRPVFLKGPRKPKGEVIPFPSIPAPPPPPPSRAMIALAAFDPVIARALAVRLDPSTDPALEGWSAPRIAELQHHLANKLSYSAIALTMSTSRGSIASAVARYCRQKEGGR